jgi:tRNA A37 N6-isopentenylltransferase MiaA
MKKNEIRTDEEAPLTTPVDASVLEYYRASPEEQLQVAKNLFAKRQKFFFRKREKLKHFLFL